jgi:hypothetical protein
MRTLLVLAIAAMAATAGAASAQAPVQAPGQAPAQLPLKTQAAPNTADLLTNTAPAGCTDCAAAEGTGSTPYRDALFTRRFWFKADYIFWYVNNQDTPPLIQVVPANQVNIGGVAPGASRTFQVYPDREGLNFDGLNGYRFTAGGYVTECWAFEASGFSLNSRNSSATVVGNGSPTSPGISRGYFSTGSNTDILLYFNLPGQYAGGVTAFASTKVYGGEFNLKRDWYRLLADRNELILGLRYMNLNEGLGATGFIGASPATGTFVLSDSFTTKNEFYGAQIGFQNAIAGFTRFQLEQTFKFGLGGVHQEAIARGQYITRDAAGNVTNNIDTGLYANAANRGVFSRDKFAFMGEYGLNLGLNLTQNAQLQVGYNITYLSAVVRPGQSIDPVINDSALPYPITPTPPASTAGRSAFDFNRASTDFWVQGVNVGFTINY